MVDHVHRDFEEILHLSPLRVKLLGLGHCAIQVQCLLSGSIVQGLEGLGSSSLQPWALGGELTASTLPHFFLGYTAHIHHVAHLLLMHRPLPLRALQIQQAVRPGVRREGAVHSAPEPGLDAGNLTVQLRNQLSCREPNCEKWLTEPGRLDRCRDPSQSAPVIRPLVAKNLTERTGSSTASTLSGELNSINPQRGAQQHQPSAGSSTASTLILTGS